MISQETLTLADEHLQSIKIHPTAILSILHSFVRRGCYKRVIGTLLGQIKEGNIEVFDCFEVPFDEKAEDLRVAIDQEYHKRMYDFHHRINKREQIVGWFSSTTPEGDYINDTTFLFNDFYAKQCKKPIIIVVDTLLRGPSFNIRGFQMKPLIIDNSGDEFANLFNELKVEIELSEVETYCINHMISNQLSDKPFQSTEILSTIPDERDQIQHSLSKLTEVIDKLIEYVDSVIEGKQVGISEIGMALSDVLGSLQTISADDVNAIYKDKVQDLLMVSYLNSLVKIQVTLADKLNAIL